MDETLGLFKYLSPDKIVFFENGLVLLTPPVYLNDPWDFLPKGTIPSEDEIMGVWREVEATVGHSSVIRLAAGFVRREQAEWLDRVRADATSSEFLAEQGRDYQEEISKIIGIVSLTELPLSRLMWAHYADSHRGFVAEFAAGAQTTMHGFSIRMCGVGSVVDGILKPVAAGKVKYRSDPQEISSNADNMHEVCWSKHVDWEGEQEWRIISPLQKSLTATRSHATSGQRVERFCLPFAPEGLRRVIFGMRMEPEVKERLCSMLGREELKHVQKQVADIDPRTGAMLLRAR
jgi:hypothetical protein